MPRMPIRDSELVEKVQAFASSIEAAKPRWLYCLSRVKQGHDYNGKSFIGYAERTVKASERIIGRFSPSAHRYSRLDELGFEGAVQAARDARFPSEPYTVGPIEPWHFGHVYIARVATHPHVVKIGFSRRVRDRLEDIESKHRIALDMAPDHLKVGSVLDEHWWHNNWRKFRISGEWFFDPFRTEREMPPFLQQAEAA